MFVAGVNSYIAHQTSKEIMFNDTSNKRYKKAKVEYEKWLAENINTNNKAFWNYVQSKTKWKSN